MSTKYIKSFLLAALILFLVIALTCLAGWLFMVTAVYFGDPAVPAIAASALIAFGSMWAVVHMFFFEE